MLTHHFNRGECIAGKKLLGYSTTIEIKRRGNYFNRPVRVSFKKTRARNSECYIDKQITIAEDIAVEQICTFLNEHHTDILNMPDKSFFPKVYTDISDVLEGEMLYAFCDDCDDRGFSAKQHGHNWQKVKDIIGSPAFCYIDKAVQAVNIKAKY